MCKELTKDVLYVTGDELAINYKWEKFSGHLNEQIQVISIDDIDHYRKKYEISALSGIHTNMVLVRHPFKPKTYVDICRDELDFFREKMECINHVASLLGATRVTWAVKSEVCEEKELKMNADGSYKITSVKMKISNEEKNKMKSACEVGNTFDGNYNEESFRQAQIYLKERRLDSDKDFRNLMELRRPTRINKVRSHKMKTEVSQELNASKEIALSLDCMDVFKMSTTIRQTIHRWRTVEMEYTIDFEKEPDN